MSEQPEIKSGLDEKTYEQLAQGAGRVIMASSRTGETSLVLSSMQISTGIRAIWYEQFCCIDRG